MRQREGHYDLEICRIMCLGAGCAAVAPGDDPAPRRVVAT